MEKDEALICAFEIAPDGTAEARAMDSISEPPREGNWLWIHLDTLHDDTRQWLRGASKIDEISADALLANETRPRVSLRPNGSLIFLRGVNLNPQSDPEDMISIRILVEADRVITTRRRRLMAVNDIRQRCERNEAPVDPGSFIIQLADGLIDRVSGVIQNLDEDLESLEHEAERGGQRIRERIVVLRHRIIPLRRYLAPQRDAIAQLLTAKVPWLDDWERHQLREVSDRVILYVEELDALRERAEVIQDTLAARLAERMNHTMMILSAVAAIFLPLGLLTGLLGINVAGIPGTETKSAFWLVCALLGLVLVFEVWLFRRLKLL